MLIASSKVIAGAMNSQAIALSERPRTRRATETGAALAVASAVFSTIEEGEIVKFSPGLLGYGKFGGPARLPIRAAILRMARIRDAAR
ncbi:hypothetical protein GCM10007919_13330 [Rhizobium indigoferae]|nr:hypothetical protein GCM10007919_13330 [Rhizobium indigoferae]